MASYDEKFKKSALELTHRMFNDACSHDADNIKFFIKNHRKHWIVDFMQDDEQERWLEIAFNMFSKEDMERAYNGTISTTGVKSACASIVNNHLYKYFCETLLDLDFEIEDWIASELSGDDISDNAIVDAQDRALDMNSYF